MCGNLFLYGNGASHGTIRRNKLDVDLIWWFLIHVDPTRLIDLRDVFIFECDNGRGFCPTKINR